MEKNVVCCTLLDDAACPEWGSELDNDIVSQSGEFMSDAGSQ